MLCCIINIVLEIVGDELTIYRICEELFNMKDTFKKYLYLAGSLFLAFALSIVLFFVLYKIDAIKSVIGHIVKTMMPFIIGAVLAYIICPLCNKLEVLFDKLFSKMKNEQTKEKNIKDIKCICRNDYCGYCNLSCTYDCYSTAD